MSLVQPQPTHHRPKKESIVNLRCVRHGRVKHGAGARYARSRQDTWHELLVCTRVQTTFIVVCTPRRWWLQSCGRLALAAGFPDQRFSELCLCRRECATRRDDPVVGPAATSPAFHPFLSRWHPRSLRFKEKATSSAATVLLQAIACLEHTGRGLDGVLDRRPAQC